MSDENISKDIKIPQSNRWYYWKTTYFPIPQKEIEHCSANIHIIPANEEVEIVLNKVRLGEIVEFSSSLVRIDAKDGWNWISSLSRTDTGHGSCEIVWVEKFSILSL